VEQEDGDEGNCAGKVAGAAGIGYSPDNGSDRDSRHEIIGRHLSQGAAPSDAEANQRRQIQQGCLGRDPLQFNAGSEDVPHLYFLIFALPPLYVAGLYLGIHVIEGYVVSPVIQQHAVPMPPALMMFAQIMLGILVGGMGVVLAAPIAAVALGAVKMLYVEDVLGDYGKEGP
jgi:hypothetical protein